MLKAMLSVGEIARRCQVKVSTVHFYEQKGLISSVRNAGNQRQFSRDVLRRISIIKVAQKIGITLKEIQGAFASLPHHRTPTKKDWRQLAKHWGDNLNNRIHYLEGLRNKLTGCIGCGCLSMENCALYNQDDHLGQTGSGPILLEP